MSDSNGIRWHCPNRDCDWSFVATTSIEGEAVRRCVCGRTMEKVDAVPAFQYLDFLREGLAGDGAIGAKKE